MHSFIYLIPISLIVILKSISMFGNFMWELKKFLTHTLLVLKLAVQIHQADQQKTAWFESDFCVKSFTYIDTPLKTDNGSSLPAICC